MQAAKCSADVKGDRVCSKWAAASCVLNLLHGAWLSVWEGCFSETAMGQEEQGLLFYQKFRPGCTLGIILASPTWLTTTLKNTSWLHSFISLCLRLISCKFSFFFHFAMSFSKISLCPLSLFFLIVFLALSNSIMAWAVSLYGWHCMLFPLGWEIDYKSQVFLWSNPVLLQTKSRFLKYSKIEQESVALLMNPDLLAVRALLKKLLPLAFFQGHCVFTPFLVPWFLGLLPACFLLLSPVSFTLIDSLTLHSMFTSGSTLHCVSYY